MVLVRLHRPERDDTREVLGLNWLSALAAAFSLLDGRTEEGEGEKAGCRQALEISYSYSCLCSYSSYYSS